MNEKREEFGDEKLLEIVNHYCCYPADTLINKIFEALNSHFGKMPQNDDMTMILLSRNTS